MLQVAQWKIFCIRQLHKCLKLNLTAKMNVIATNLGGKTRINLFISN